MFPDSGATGPKSIIQNVYVELLSGSALGSSSDDFVIVQWKAAVDDQWIAPLHVHHRDDEAWYVLSGTLGFRVGDQDVEARPGAAVLARRGMPHTFWNAGQTEAEYLLVMTPRIADLVEQIHAPGADVPAIFASHDSEILSSE
jgi:mannose-6-phosphate isomerase-like protein (cupin superfamily)